MDTLLIAGIESVAGANLAAVLSERYRIIGLTPAEAVAIEGCQIHVGPIDDPDLIRQHAAASRPDWIVYCPPEAASSWQHAERPLAKSRSLRAARAWAETAADCKARLSFVSSDAVFTGPWMFHAEQSSCLCPSPQAELIRNMELITLKVCPDALVARTHVYGWTPAGAGTGWIERVLAELESGCAAPYDHVRHSTPIVATDFAELLELSYRKHLNGMYHIAGAERVNPSQVVDRLAEQFQLPAPRLGASGSLLVDRPIGFGCGETSLQTGKIRDMLGVGMPMLADGLRRLFQQAHNGHRDRLTATPEHVGELVA